MGERNPSSPHLCLSKSHFKTETQTNIDNNGRMFGTKQVSSPCYSLLILSLCAIQPLSYHLLGLTNKIKYVYYRHPNTKPPRCGHDEAEKTKYLEPKKFSIVKYMKWYTKISLICCQLVVVSIIQSTCLIR